MMSSNEIQQTLLFDDGEAGKNFIAQHDRGTVIPASKKKHFFNNEDFIELGNGGTIADGELLQTAKNYYATKIDSIIEFLTASGLTADEINIVTSDYWIALCGNYNFEATPDVMNSVLQKVAPYKAFIIDKYGLYWQLFQRYFSYGRTVYEYQARIYQATEQEKTAYLNEMVQRSRPLRRAFVWALDNQYIRLLDFTGIPTGELVQFAFEIRKLSELMDYGQFYHLCKYAYFATPEQLKAIPQPKGLSGDTKQILEFAELFSTETETALNEKNETFVTIIDKDTPPQEREKEQEQAGRWKATEIKISKNLNAIMQKPIEASKTRIPQYQTDTLPIRNHIEAFLMRPTNAMFNNGLLTEDLLQRTIGGLDLIRSIHTYTKTKIGNNNVYVFQTNISEFSEFCGFQDANQQQKIALFGCLMLLKDVYIRTTSPYRVRKTKKGKKYTVGGDDYVQVANIPVFQYDGETIGKFTIQITADDLGGELMPITADTYQRLRQEAKGTSERRFQAQLLGKDNKNENDLVDECFGFADMLKYATPEDLKGVRKYVSGHRKTASEKVRAWFEKYKELGVIASYTYKQNRAGEWVYSWKRSNPKQIQAPDANLITDAEIVDAEQGTGENQPSEQPTGKNA